jgi:indole-3-glycerol phosphate synthase/phosphoribosylanthranilate isomerase
MHILERILATRSARVSREGHTLGVKLPGTRPFPLVPFGTDPFVICEVKRRSPSRGAISRAADAVSQAGEYVRRGVKSISVLTEEDHFSGSLGDLVSIKSAFGHVSVLRKDFLVDEEDLQVSFRAGADAVLLIAKVLEEPVLHRLYNLSREMGMEVLFELHDGEDLAKARTIRPSITGINSRDLKSFRMDPESAAKLRGRVDWNTRCVFESGIRGEADALRALSSGFEGLLIGEAVMNDPELITRIVPLFHGPFWRRLYSHKNGNRPLVKICGITREQDAFEAAELGANVIGFVFAPSPRRAEAALVAGLENLDVLKVGVVVTGGEPIRIPDELRALLEAGLLDALQFHGNETPAGLSGFPFPYFKALRLKDDRSIQDAAGFRCPRVLLDAYAAGVPGGTGREIPAPLISAAAGQLPLWIAGGIGPGNVRLLVERYHPELVDASSMLESSPGVKDRMAMKNFFEEIERADL